MSFGSRARGAGRDLNDSLRESDDQRVVFVREDGHKKHGDILQIH